MKAFKKWFRINHQKKDTNLWCCSTEKAVAQGWRASMEQVMRWGMDHYGNDFLFMDLCKDIRKELRGNSEPPQSEE